jgi:hypothetical protein
MQEVQAEDRERLTENCKGNTVRQQCDKIDHCVYRFNLNISHYSVTGTKCNCPLRLTANRTNFTHFPVEIFVSRKRVRLITSLAL